VSPNESVRCGSAGHPVNVKWRGAVSPVAVEAGPASKLPENGVNAEEPPSAVRPAAKRTAAAGKLKAEATARKAGPQAMSFATETASGDLKIEMAPRMTKAEEQAGKHKAAATARRAGKANPEKANAKKANAEKAAMKPRAKQAAGDVKKKTARAAASAGHEEAPRPGKVEEPAGKSQAEKTSDGGPKTGQASGKRGIKEATGEQVGAPVLKNLNANSL
jgi:hypothetical protein